jgi:hypothetical protein
MIDDVINFLRQQLDAYLSDGRASAEPLMVLSNPWNNNDTNKGSSFFNALSLINIEEEKVFRTQGMQTVHLDNGMYKQKVPDLKLNIYVLISAYNKNYEDGLRFISKVISYFQSNSVFDQNGGDAKIAVAMPTLVNKIVMELYTLSFEQQNQIWASLSAGYLPSVVYKVRTIIIDPGVKKDSESYQSIKEINIATKLGTG